MKTIVKVAGPSIALGIAIGLAPVAHAAPSYTLTINGKQVDSSTDVRCFPHMVNGRPGIGRPAIDIQMNKATAGHTQSQAYITTYTDGSSDPIINLTYGD